jgi:hypothetical protein
VKSLYIYPQFKDIFHMSENTDAVDACCRSLIDANSSLETLTQHTLQLREV